MRRLTVWRKRIAAALEWSPVDKGLILMAMAIPLYLQYFLWSLYVISRPDSHSLVHTEVVKRVMEVELLLIAIGSLIVIAGIFLRRRRPDYLPFQHATLQYYSLSLVLMSYSIGTLSFPVGIVLLGAPIFGFILLNRRAVWWAAASAFSLLMALSYAAASGDIPYAPSKVHPASSHAFTFWMLSELFFAAPFLILITFMADQMLTWWRDREDQIRELSRRDGLTGLANRRHILSEADAATARARRDEQPLAVVILDLDHFKRVNDSHGHGTGDRVLKASAERLSAALRAGDSVGRYGGEEFLLVLPNTDASEAHAVAERCRLSLQALIVHNDKGLRVPVTASFGLTLLSPTDSSVNAAIGRADEALYQAKGHGRNRVETLLAGSGMVPSDAFSKAPQA